MIKKEDILADMHTHTVFSKHAYSTLRENICCAKQKGLKYVALTDHFFLNTANTIDADLENKNMFARIMYANNVRDNTGVCVINGAEFNLKQGLSSLVGRKAEDRILWRPVGLHTWFVDKHIVNEKGSVLLDSLKYDEEGKFIWCTHNIYTLWLDIVDLDSDYGIKPTAFVHIERELDKCVDQENVEALLYMIVDLAKTWNMYLELNETSIVTDKNNSNLNRMKIWVPYAVEKGVKFCLGSDAHYCEDVGEFTNVLKLINEYEIPKSRILNCNERALQQFVL